MNEKLQGGTASTLCPPGWGPKTLGPEEGTVSSGERVTGRTTGDNPTKGIRPEPLAGGPGACRPHVVGGFRAKADAPYHTRVLGGLSGAGFDLNPFGVSRDGT